MIHPTAIISKSAKLDSSVEVGPYSVIHDNVMIDSNTVIESHVVIKNYTTIGKNNHIYQFASIGEDPQDLKYKGEDSKLIIGDNNIFREYSTVNRGTVTGINKTIIGSNNLFMAYTHVAHDCVIKDHCILSNAASLAGHVTLGKSVSLGGFTLVHQFCDIGDYAFSGLGTVISRDVTPFTLVAGNHAQAYKINSAGLKRKGFSDEVIRSLEKTFKLFVKSKSNRSQVNESFKKLGIDCQEVDYFIDFVNSSERGITR
jgi:UDP-N-acetylglucosamine acyltransferase|tara:strand:- start:42 stop:812 length:771 start_codon:yes stop_codon:yes gene_type:complete